MTEWYETTGGIWTNLWDTLAQGVADAGHPARRPTFATISRDGWPEARTVVLRAQDRTAAILTVHTDILSHKIKSLRQTSRAAFHFWDAEQNLQIRMQTQVTIQSGSMVRPLWDRTPNHAQQSYGVTPPPGTAIDTALDYVKCPDPATFAVLECQVTYIDVVHLGADHRRVCFSQGRYWQGQWLSP